MIRDDYIMRMIEQLARVLARIFFNKQAGKYKEAIADVETAFKGIMGLDYGLIAFMSIEDITSLLKINKESTVAKCIVGAKLFKERTEILELSNADKSEINYGYQKSLSLYIEAILNDEDQSANELVGYYSDIDIVISKLDLSKIPDDLRFKLFKYYELTGKFSKAEDELFRLKELDYDNIEQEGISFYKKLEKLSDSELEKGNFSKEEVFEGWAAFVQKRE